MIHKIQRLISVGKFRNYTTAGDVCFQKLTMIYAKNGIGNTTLSTVIRSLATLKPELVRNRKSTNSTTPIAAQITQRDSLSNDTSHNLGANGWSNPFPNIEVFDIHFVNENVYSGFEFSKEHKEELYNFVLGQQAVALQVQINSNKASKAGSVALKESYETQIIQQAGNGLTAAMLPAFMQINPATVTNITGQIATAEVALLSAQHETIIQSFQPLLALQAFNANIDFAELISDLAASSQTIQEVALQSLYDAHRQELADNSIVESEHWLRQGFNYLSAKTTSATNPQQPDLLCPFCKQPVNSTLEIINAYSLHFNDTFNSYVSRLTSYREALQNINLDSVILQWNNTNQLNSDRTANWSAHLPATTQTPSYNIIADEQVFRQELQALTNIVISKLQNPFVVVATTTSTIFQNSVTLINQNITTYNQSVTAYDAAITIFRASIQTVASAQLTLESLRRTERRCLPAILTLCSHLRAERQNHRNLSDAYARMMESARLSSNALLHNYQTRINHYLNTVFHTPFRVTGSNVVPPHGQNTVNRAEYTLTIDGQNISTDPNLPNAAKDVLSEGDKTTIALAFFLAKLDVENIKDQKAIIFDDPLSSFDNSRRTTTVSLLAKLAKEAKQLVVLSHDRKFLFDLNRRVRSVMKKGLEIVYDETNNTSKIQFLEIDKMLQNDYFICLNKIKDFIATGTDEGKRECRREIRIALENYLIFYYYNHLGGNLSTTFGDLVNRLEELYTAGTITFRDSDGQQVIDDLKELNEISWDSHHGDGDILETRDEILVEDIDLTAFKGYLQTTLDLIEKRL